MLNHLIAAKVVFSITTCCFAICASKAAQPNQNIDAVFGGKTLDSILLIRESEDVRTLLNYSLVSDRTEVIYRSHGSLFEGAPHLHFGLEIPETGQYLVSTEDKGLILCQETRDGNGNTSIIAPPERGIITGVAGSAVNPRADVVCLQNMSNHTLVAYSVTEQCILDRSASLPNRAMPGMIQWKDHQSLHYYGVDGVIREMQIGPEGITNVQETDRVDVPKGAVIKGFVDAKAVSYDSDTLYIGQSIVTELEQPNDVKGSIFPRFTVGTGDDHIILYDHGRVSGTAKQRITIFDKSGAKVSRVSVSQDAILVALSRFRDLPGFQILLVRANKVFLLASECDSIKRTLLGQID